MRLMRTIVRRKLSGHILGIILFLFGFGVLFLIVWRAWPSVSGSSNILSALWSHILTEYVELALIGTLRLAYIGIIGVIFLFLGILALVFSRQIFHLSSGPVLLKCSYCGNHWNARRGMGWAECPHCRKFVQPRVVKAEK